MGQFKELLKNQETHQLSSSASLDYVMPVPQQDSRYISYINPIFMLNPLSTQIILQTIYITTACSTPGKNLVHSKSSQYPWQHLSSNGSRTWNLGRKRRLSISQRPRSIITLEKQLIPESTHSCVDSRGRICLRRWTQLRGRIFHGNRTGYLCQHKLSARFVWIHYHGN